MRNSSYTLKPGQQIESYQITQVLGAGGFGITYQAHDLNLDVAVAIKEYFPHGVAVRDTDGVTVLAKSEEDESMFAYGLQRYLDEARTLALFKNQNIVRVSSYLEKNGTAYIIMDYEDGVPLSRYLMRSKSLSEEEIKNVFRPILRGLMVVHGKDFLHRDIKPSNIYLRKHGSPVLLDFGAARQALNQHDRSITNLGTHGYAPIEQFTYHEEQGPWTDIYGVGATIYCCITGSAPITAMDRIAALQGGRIDPLSPAEFLNKPGYSKELLQCVDWMLNVQGRDRPQNIEQILPVFSQQGQPRPDTILTETDVDWDAELVEQAERHLAKYLGPLANTIVKQCMSKSTSIEDLYHMLGKQIDSVTDRDLFLRSVQASSSLTGKVEKRQQERATAVMQQDKTVVAPQRIPDATRQQMEKLLAAEIGPLAGMLVKQAIQNNPDLKSIVDVLCNELPSEELRQSFRSQILSNKE